MSHQPDTLIRVTRRIIGRLRGSASAFAAAGLAVAVAIATSVAGVWVFRRPSTQTTDDSVWRLLLTDRATVGFVRAAVIMLALYTIASTAALAMSGRWLKALKTSGIEADDARVADSTIRSLEEQVRRAEQELGEAKRLLWRVLYG